MKIDKPTIEYIVNVVKTAKQVGIEDVIIEPNLVRGIDPNKVVLINQTKDVPELDFGSIGLVRIDSFLSRFDLVKALNYEIEVATDTGAGGAMIAKSLLMKAKGIKIDYRCANPLAIKAPRQLNDIARFRIQYAADTVSLLQKAYASMGADNLSIISNKDGVSFEFCDTNNDVLKHTFTDTVTPLDGGNVTEFAHRFPSKVVLSLLKQNPDGHFDLGAKGTFGFVSNNLKIYILPQV